MKDKTTVTLGDLARALNATLTGMDSTEVQDVTHDSRQVRPGMLFVAVRGLVVDGNRFVTQALELGAAGIVSEKNPPENFVGGWIKVADSRRALALCSAEVHRHASRELHLVGITGTNGKTTTAYIVAAIAKAAGVDGAMLTTVESQIGNLRKKAERTTPEASDTQRFLRQAVDAGCSVAVMECSSQALDLNRCDCLCVDIAVFTNLTRDHLDYHRTMERYFDAKLCLFDGRVGQTPRVSIINVDDAFGVKLANTLKARNGRVVGYALDQTADVMARNIEITLEGMTFELVTATGSRTFLSPLVGRPHVYNILAAVSCGFELGYDLESMAKGVAICTGAPGRFERVPHAGDFAVVVDYAHTDDALLNVLRTAREVASGRIITVFGCGGDRDRSKRAPMGEAAGSLSDLVILTSDNPRTEDPLAILADVEVGLQQVRKPYRKIADRREAIFQAVADANTGDVVVIAGKGHEDYQIIGKTITHFDDREVAMQALAARS